MRKQLDCFVLICFIVTCYDPACIHYTCSDFRDALLLQRIGLAGVCCVCEISNYNQSNYFSYIQ
jgi:hypothetical protein